MEIKIACAPNLSGIIDELILAYDSKCTTFSITIGQNCNVYFNEILSGKTYDIFLSADIESAKKLVAQNFASEFRTYASGKVCLWSYKEVANIEAIKGGVKIAMPDPNIAPYGKAAKEFLQNNNLWDIVFDNLVFATNPSEVSQLVIKDIAKIAFLPISFVKSTLKSTNFVILDSNAYKTINQAGALLNNASSEAKAFFYWIFSPKAREIFEKYGL